jgi:hypothetical protein
MDHEEVYPLLKRLEEGYQQSTRRDNLPDILTPEMIEQEKLQERMYITGRHGLNYAKLYHNVDGGYEME